MKIRMIIGYIGPVRLLRACISIFLAVCLLFISSSVFGAQVSSETAASAVKGWLQLDHTPMGEPLGNQVKTVETIKDKAGAPLYYVVYLNPSGFVIVSGDDLVEPIIAFARQGRFDPSLANPLGALVSQDIPGRVARARSLGTATNGGPFLVTHSKWQLLRQNSSTPTGTNGGTAQPMGISSVSDVRRFPFVQTSWNQQTVPVSAPSDAACIPCLLGPCYETCYNYYTPPGPNCNLNNDPCGCVATAMAQVMYYFQYPSSGVGTGSFTIYVNGVQQSANLLGGNGTGGPYAWGSMPLAPNNSTIAQCQAIGALTYDAGVAVHMQYASGGSEAYGSDAKKALVSTFMYGNAVFGGSDDGSQNIGAGLINMVNPNLDTYFPVIFCIGGNPVGNHCVVCDGYGFNASTMYHHLNLGWSGTDTVWYNLPTIDTTSDGTWTNIFSCIYNIFKNGSGEIISGRVVDNTGAPVANASVTATRNGGGTYTATTPTDNEGIYYIVGVPSNSQYALSVTKSGYISVNTIYSYSTGQSSDNSAMSGNYWGANFTLNPQPAMTTTNTLNVASSNPGSGVSITVSPNDTGGNGNGSTPFTRAYTNNTQVTLTAPSSAGGNNFQKWQQNGVDYSTSLSTTITMNANYTMTAVYTSPPSATYTLTVTSSNPNSGVSISASPSDNSGLGSGSTPFSLTYNSNKLVYLTAPATAGGNNFQTWQLDGVTYNNALDSGLTMNGNHTMTAVYGGIGIIALSGNLAFGSVQTGAQAVREFTIQSQGGYQSINVSSISYPSGFSGAWSGTIPLNGSTNISVTFSPTTNITYGGWVVVYSDATIGSNSNSISGTGVALPPPPPVTPFPVAPFSVIYSFPYVSPLLSGYWPFGEYPEAGLVQGSDGNFYGSTAEGGNNGNGVIFRINPQGSNQLLYAFPANPGGGEPMAPLIQANNGIFYGTAEQGGTSHSLGSIFSITTNGQFNTLYQFSDTNDGCYPVAPVIQATDGNLYGTSSSGGDGYGGAAFKITTSGTFTLLNGFDSPSGPSDPTAPLVQGQDGNFYGTGNFVEDGGSGSIFRMNSSGVVTNLYTFSDGCRPESGLVRASDGNFYGISSIGGAYGNGTVYRVTTNGALTTLYSFTGGNDGAPINSPRPLLPPPYGPSPPLIQATDGNFYGTTYYGGAFGDGTVFQITTNGVLTTLHAFSGSPDGASPCAGLVQGQDGNLYGTTTSGGIPENGVPAGGAVFRLVIPPGTPSVTLTGGMLNISWNAVPGQTYQIQYNTDLRQTNWMSLISAITATNSTATATDVVGPDAQRFYRIVEFPEAW